MSGITQPVEWILISLIGLLTMVISILLLNKERENRKSRSNTFATKFLKIGPILCIISGISFGCSQFVLFFNGFCHIAGYWNVISIGSQAVIMGFYQLSRLYYCFAQNKVYSNKGYPNWLFLIMYTFGAIYFFYNVIFPLFFLQSYLPKSCGINSQYQAIHSLPIKNKTLAICLQMATNVYVLWDVLTLLLYIIKMITIHYKYRNQSDSDVHIRIMSILKRILLLTMFYEIFALLAGIVTNITNNSETNNFLLYQFLSFSMVSLSITYSMFLMQQHNADQYRQFLQLLYYSNLYYICCCCCKSMIIYELEMHQTDKMNIKCSNEENKTNNDHDTINETKDHSIKLEHSKVPELSIETKV
eukprot:307009_1